MEKKISSIIAILLSSFVFLFAASNSVYAYSEIPDCFDFGESTISINAGESYKMHIRANYDYTYYVEGATSNATYMECSFSSGSQDVVFHIGSDEQGKNVFFHFYVTDDRLQTQDKHDCVEVYVKNAIPTNDSVSAPIAGGKTGTLVKNGNISMLYNENSVAMASFSLGNGTGAMVSYGQVGIVNNGANYFNLISGNSNVTPMISESDKAVMIGNGYAGICIGGKYINWP